MGRHIDLNKPLSDEDRAYFEERSMREVIELNDRKFGDGGSGPDPEPKEDDSDGVEVSQAVYDEVMSLTEPELDTKLQHYGFPPEGNIRDKRTRLAIQLQEDEDAREADRNKEKKAKEAHEADPTK